MLRTLGVALCCSVAAHAQTTWTVPASGSIQSYIDAAAPGDVIVLTGSSYGDSFTIDKGLTFIGSPSTKTRLSYFQQDAIIDLPGAAVRFVDIGSPPAPTSQPSPFIPRTSFVIRGGTVVFERCDIEKSWPAQAATGAVNVHGGVAVFDHCTVAGIRGCEAIVAENAHVTLVSSNVTGSDSSHWSDPHGSFFISGRSGIVATSGATLHITGSTMEGGNASPESNAAPGVRSISDNAIWITDSTVRGGESTISFSHPGSALQGQTFEIARNSLAAGAGLNPPPVIDGTAIAESRLMGVDDTPALDLGMPYALTLRTDPSATVALLFSTGSIGTIDVPGLLAQPLLNDGTFLAQVALGTTNPNGEFSFGFTLPNDTALEHRTFHFYGVRGVDLPLQLAPPCGGTLR